MNHQWFTQKMINNNNENNILEENLEARLLLSKKEQENTEADNDPLEAFSKYSSGSQNFWVL